MKIEEEFWAALSAATASGCREWTKSVRATGYGQVNWRRRNVSTHRLAYELAIGPIQSGLCVCHHCDNRRCCNPDHLFLGTHLDNHRDMIAKGRKRWRASPGSAQGNAKLDEKSVALIKQRLAAGEMGKWLAAEFGVSPSAISIINVGKGWRHV